MPLHNAEWILLIRWIILPQTLMSRLICQTAFMTFLLSGTFLAPAQNLDQIGVILLRAVTTNLDGSGIRVAQPEANTDGNTNHPSAFEVNPAAVAQPTNLFAYASALGTATGFTNAVGNESGHADGVAANFYGRTGYGVATNVAHVDNYDADFFITNYVFNLLPMPAAAVVNQSFTFGPLSISDQQAVDSAYDDYEENFGALFVSAVSNGGQVCAPGTAYNSITVGAFGGSSSIGPTIDNGRCKPDITAPAGVTSFSTPQVSGAAAVLMQAALRGDGGSDTNAAFDLRTIKALLLNGAVKPADWTNSNSSPLDARYGAGVLNVLNSYEQLAGGKQVFCTSNLVSLAAPHPPVVTTNIIPANSGWDAEIISSDATNNSVNHYLFNVSNGMMTATLVWNRQFGETNINNLDLYLFNAANSNLIACSTSRVDNVEHLFVPQLAAGRYDLQVLKNGGANVVSDGETYALAWAFVSPTLNLSQTGTNALLSWLVYPAGFLVEAATNLATPTWSTNTLPAAVITSNRNSLTLNATNATQFFRLRSPDF
jgi:Subtilase family